MVQIQGSRMRCPDCGAWLDLPITVGETTQVGNQIVMPVGILEDQFREDMTAHVMADPEAHPTFTQRDG